MRVLVVEDEQKIADFIRKGLTEHGYAVDVAFDGEEALDWPAVANFDIIVLDVMLPVRDGVDVCRTLRQRGVRTPVLMLTAKDTVEDRVLGLDSGADDYLVKPFAFAELLARLRALTRRQPAVLGSLLKIGDLALDTATRSSQCRPPRREPCHPPHVEEHRTLNPGGVLPVVLAVPGVLALAFAGLRVAHRRGHKAG